jgi:3-phenylpropionate/cinnamic acid dioxygenase small subunit
MTATEDFRTLSRRDLRLVLEEFYADYVACLDEERFEDWPEFFTDDAVYRIIPRENFDRGLPIATLHAESKGYLKDRVVAIRQTAVYAPRYMRRLVSNIRILGWRDGGLEVRANYAAFETLRDELTRIFSVGRYADKLVVDGGGLKFKEKLVIFDSELIPNSLVYPL